MFKRTIKKTIFPINNSQMRNVLNTAEGNRKERY